MNVKQSTRGRKPLLKDKELQVIHTTKSLKLIIGGKDTVRIGKKKNILILRDFS
jgi:hypothetical protein